MQPRVLELRGIELTSFQVRPSIEANLAFNLRAYLSRRIIGEAFWISGLSAKGILLRTILRMLIDGHIMKYLDALWEALKFHWTGALDPRANVV